MSFAPLLSWSVPIPAINSLELLASSPGTGKTTYCLEAFKSEILKTKSGIDSRVFFILPSREHTERIEHLLFKKELPGLFNAHLLTIHDFAARLLGVLAGTTPSDEVRRGLIGEALETGGTPYFHEVKDARGFHELLGDALKEFKAGLLSLAAFERLSRPLMKDAVYRAKFNDFCAVFKRYEESLKKLGLKEPEDNIAKLLQDKRSGLYADLVIFDGFYHFTRAQKFLIKFIAARTRRMIVTLTLPPCSERRPELFEFPQATRDFLIQIGFREKKEGFSENHRTASRTLQHLEQNVFLTHVLNPLESRGEVQILEAPNPKAEVEIIASRIKKLYRETSIHYSDVSLILRRIGPYEELIESVFKDFEIPVHIHERKKLIQQGIVATWARLLNLLTEDWKREDVLYLLKSSYLKKRFSLGQALEVQAQALRFNLLQGRENWQSLLKENRVSLEAKRALEGLFLWESRFLSVKQVSDFSRLFDLFLKDFEIVWEPASCEAEAVAAVKAHLEGVRKYYRVSSKREFACLNFIRELGEALKSGLFSYSPPGKNRVQVYDVVMAIPKEYKIVFMPGLLEKNFPQAPEEDPLFKDSERRVLNRCGAVLDPRLKRIAGERYFFYMGLTRASDRVYLSYPLYDNELKPTLPSFFIEEVKRCFKNISIYRRQISEPIPNPSEWESHEEVSLGLAPLFSEALSTSEPHKKILEAWFDKESFNEIKSFAANPEEAVVTDERVKKIFRDFKGPFSPTRLETYATCAFKFFSSRILHLAEPPEGREFLEMGNLLHKVLEEFYRKIPKSLRDGAGLWKDESAMPKRLVELLDVFFEKSFFENEPPYRRQVSRDFLKRTLLIFAEKERELWQKRGLKPSFFELAFGEAQENTKNKKAGLDFLKIKEGAGEILVQGKIDRIDIAADEPLALVLDYKLSERPESIRKKIAMGLELQIPLYLLAVRRLMGLEVGGGELRFLTSGKTDGLYRKSTAGRFSVHSRRVWEDKDFEAILSDAEDRVRALVARLRSADISVKSKTCRHCAFSSVCRFEPWRLIYSEGPGDAE